MILQRINILLLLLAPAFAACETRVTKTTTTVQIDDERQPDVKISPKDVQKAKDIAVDVAAPFAGCTGASDQSLLNATADPKSAAFLKDDLRTCTLMKGCGAKADFGLKIQCISDCMLLNWAVGGLTDPCGLCFGFSGQCGVEKCIAKCAVDTGECAPCLAVFCDNGTDKCRAGQCEPKSGGCSSK